MELKSRIPTLRFGNVAAMALGLFMAGTLHVLAQTRPVPALQRHNVPAMTPPAAAPVDGVYVVEIQGRVEILPRAGGGWSPAQTNQMLHPFDQVRSGENSRLALRWSDQSLVSFGPSTELEILPPDVPNDEAGLHLIRGIVSFFHRDTPGRIRIITRGAAAGVEGTEFALAVDGADVTTLSVIDGKVRLGNAQATLVLTNGEQAVVAPGSAPVRTAGFIANNVLQWCFYYPAVLDPDELQLTAGEQNDLAASLSAYRSGDLLGALARYPAGRPDASDRERVYHAAVQLAVGNVEAAEAAMAAVSPGAGRPAQLAGALRELIAAVKRQPAVAGGEPRLASEFLAASYFEQSRATRETSLVAALKLARKATTVSPQFGFAWERVAELEFSFGRTRDALKALTKSVALSPKNAQALALEGFIYAAQGRPGKARDWFDRAIATDSALGNAWLGRGLVRIHGGDKAGGREDLLVAAALEPQRAELRSYLGKAYAHAGDDTRATHELALAKKLDPNDPTAWLYSALLNQQDNQINDAIRDLEKSQALNDNRSVYRSQLLLDQDSAVRSANLAWMYQDDGMFDWSVREAGRAASTDYANYSAHLFLANSYDQLRDPNWNNLRYESPGEDEFYIANLLAPVNAGWLSPVTSEQSRARLFDQNRFGFVSDTTYLSRQAWTENLAQFGISDVLSYNLETSYDYDPGQRPNDSFSHRDVDLAIKGRLTSQDTVFADVQQIQLRYGDVGEYYSANHRPYPEHFAELQSPNLYAGLHHEWSPGLHTLVFGAYLDANDSGFDRTGSEWVQWNYNTFFNAVRSAPDRVLASIGEKVYVGEIQQIWETSHNTTVLGARYFGGNINFQNHEWDPSGTAANVLYGYLGSPNPDPKHFPYEVARQNLTDEVHHETLYAYHIWQILDSLQLSAGLDYDYLEQPAIVNTLPYESLMKAQAQVSPKAGLIWTPLKDTTVRAAFTRSLSGFANDSSIRIEPTEMAGFNQAYRSIIPDSVVGDTSGSKLSTVDLSLEQKFGTGTYLAAAGEILYSDLLKYNGAYFFDGSGPGDNLAVLDPLRQTLEYREPSLTFSIDQLWGKQWAAGARYRVSQANLNLSYPYLPLNIPPGSLDAPFKLRQDLKSTLETVSLHANWNHPSGLFSVLEADWYHQNNAGFSPVEPGDAFWQINANIGCRFWHRRAEISVGVLNLLDRNYRLEPLNLYNEMARSRTYTVRLLISF